MWACLGMSGPLWAPISQPAPQPTSEAHNRLVLCTLGVTYIHTYIFCGRFYIERPTEAQRGLERRPRDARRGSHRPKRPRAAQRSLENLREAQKRTERPRETQKGPEKPKEAYIHTYICTHISR